MLRKKIILVIAIMLVIAMSITACLRQDKGGPGNAVASSAAKSGKWIIPDTIELVNNQSAALIKYGRSLIINTSYYFGPKGIVARVSNGMNCQNCHLNAGTKLFGNNFSLTAVGYPRFKERSGTVETLVKKVQDCFERSLNGRKIDSNSREMQAFVAYLQWIGKNVKKGTKPKGSGIEELAFLNHPADTLKGKALFAAKCQVCHGTDGLGKLNRTGNGYTYPPLWGDHSYNIGASIYRLSKFAGFIKNNMPFGADYQNMQLTGEQAWDIAAFVNSKSHPYKNIDADWPKPETKPYDYPFGPYPEKLFSNDQHKYGPFAPIKKYYAELGKKK